jgi:hypothetical protein
MTDEVFIEFFNKSAINQLMKIDSENNYAEPDNLIIEIAGKFKINVNEIRKTIEAELPLLTELPEETKNE